MLTSLSTKELGFAAGQKVAICASVLAAKAESTQTDLTTAMRVFDTGLGDIYTHQDDKGVCDAVLIIQTGLKPDPEWWVAKEIVK